MLVCSTSWLVSEQVLICSISKLINELILINELVLQETIWMVYIDIYVEVPSATFLSNWVRKKGGWWGYRLKWRKSCNKTCGLY